MGGGARPAPAARVSDGVVRAAVRRLDLAERAVELELMLEQCGPDEHLSRALRAVGKELYEVERMEEHT